MSFSSEQEFYSEGVPRDPHKEAARSKWFIAGALLLLLIAITVAFYLPIELQRRHLAHLRSQGAFVQSIPQESCWYELTQIVHDYTQLQLPVMQDVLFVECHNLQASADTLEDISRYSTLDQLSFHSGTFNEQALDQLLGQLPELSFLRIVSCAEISNLWVQRARSRYPKLVIDYRSPAFLGISANLIAEDGQGCIIQYVYPNGAADLSGMKALDVITSINMQPIQSFHDVIMLLGDHQPGDEIEITVQRNNEQVVLNCELGTWGDVNL